MVDALYIRFWYAGLQTRRVMIVRLTQVSQHPIHTSISICCPAGLQLLEQAMDPTHANFLHAGVGFKSEDALPMAPMAGVQHVDVKTGFTWVHGGYEKKNANMSAVREFHPPCFTRCGR